MEHDPRLAELVDLLTDAAVRVTSVAREDAAERHVADALTALPLLEGEDGPLADVGSGGGVPGLVLAIARPAWPVTLVESHGRKAAQLHELADRLGLANVDGRHEPRRGLRPRRGPRRASAS